MSNDTDLKYKKAFEFFDAKQYEKAQYLLEDILGSVRMTERAEKVYFHYAYTHYHMDNFPIAANYFERFNTMFPNGPYTEEALYMSAISYVKLSPAFRLTQEDTERAIAGLQVFANTYPNSERIEGCNRKIDELRAKLEVKSIEAAKGYYKRKQYEAASKYFGNLLLEYPDSPKAEYVRYMIAKANYQYALKSILSKQIERLEVAKKACAQFKKRHDKSSYASEIETIYTSANIKIKKIRNEL